MPCLGKLGRVTLLLKDPSRPVEEAKIPGITVYPQISKVELVALYTEASAVYERALGRPLLVGGMQGISFHKVVRTVDMALRMARLRGQIVDTLIGDQAKYLDAIAQVVHPTLGNHGGCTLLITSICTHRDIGTPCPSGLCKATCCIPQGRIQGVNVGATTSLSFVMMIGLAKAPCAISLIHHPMMMWVDDTITTLSRGEDRAIQGAVVD